MWQSEQKGPLWEKSQPTFILNGHSRQLPSTGPYEAKTQTWKVVQRRTTRPYLWKKHPKTLSFTQQFTVFSGLVPRSSQIYETNRSGIPALTAVLHDLEDVASLSLGFSFLTCKKHSILTKLSHITSSKLMPLHHSPEHEADKNQIITPIRM